MSTTPEPRVLGSNTETFKVHEPSRARRSVWLWIVVVGVGVAGALLVLTAVARGVPAQTAPVPTAAAAAATVVQASAAPTAVAGATGDPSGSRIVQSPCMDVGARQCLKLDPPLRPAIELLRGTTRGPDLLKTAADNDVAIRAGKAPAGALAAFRYSNHTVTLDTSLMRYSARGQAAVLAHELRHVSDWSKIGTRLSSNSLNCYSTEANAFQTEAAVWNELKGSSPPADRLEREVAQMTDGVDHGGAGFWLSLGSDYLEECA